MRLEKECYTKSKYFFNGSSIKFSKCMRVNKIAVIAFIILALLIISGRRTFFGSSGSGEGSAVGELDLSVRRAGPPPVESTPTIFHQGDRSLLLVDFILQNHRAEDAEVSMLYLSPTTFLNDAPGERLNDTAEELAAVGSLDLFGDSVLLGSSVILPPGSMSPSYPESVIRFAEFSIPVSPPVVIPGNSQKKFRLVLNSAVNEDVASRALFGISLDILRAHNAGVPASTRAVANMSEDAAHPGELLSSVNSIWAPKLWTLGSPYIHIDP